MFEEFYGCIVNSFHSFLTLCPTLGASVSSFVECFGHQVNFVLI